MQKAVANRLGERLHLQHGPIDLIIGVEGPAAVVEAAFARAYDKFCDVLDGLVAELPRLRRPLTSKNSIEYNNFNGKVAQRMVMAIQPHCGRFTGDDFITPMAAVAGSVADHILAAIISDLVMPSTNGLAQLPSAPVMGDGITRAYVNNGGDIAVYLGPGAIFDIGIADDRDVGLTDFMQMINHGQGGKLPLDGRVRLQHGDGVGGIATSGWRGRSLSLGIADMVTVLAINAAAADVAATLIANAINIDTAKIDRLPACEIDPDSDLGHRLITQHVADLTMAEIDTALGKGASLANMFLDEGKIIAAYGRLQGQGFVVS